MTSERELIYLRSENKRLWATRLCWDNGKRLCDTDRGNDSRCGTPAAQLWIDPQGDDFYFCSDECREYVLCYQGGSVELIGEAHSFTIYSYTPDTEEENEHERDAESLPAMP